jgi:hypothetical protein
LKRALEGLGGRNIDTRTTLGKAPAQWRVDLVADLGGREAISTQQAAVIDLAVKTTLLLNSIDAWLPTQPVTLVDRRRRALIPVVGERQQLAPITYVSAQLGHATRRPSSSTTPAGSQTRRRGAR